MAITVAMRTQITELYVALFGKAPDADGLGFWVQKLDSGVSFAAIAQAMYNTEPARAYYPSFLTNTEIITSFYVNVLGRQPDTEGLNFWLGRLAAQGSDPNAKGNVIAEMINVVMNYHGTDPAGLASAALFQNKVAVAQFYAEHVGTLDTNNVLGTVTSDPASVTAAETAILNAQSNKTVFLTTAGDTVSNVANVQGDLSPFLFNGTGPTLNSNDKITNVGTLTITDQFGTGVDVIPVGATLDQIQHIVLNTQGNAGASGVGVGLPIATGAAFDVSKVNGLIDVTVTSAGAAADFITAANFTNVNSVQKNQAGGVLITGGNFVSVDSSGAGGVVVGSQFAGGSNFGTPSDTPAGDVTVTERNAGSGSVLVYGGKNVTVNVTSQTNYGRVDIGNTPFNTGDNVDGGFTNPTGNITVTSVSNVNALGGSGTTPGITIFGGANVTVNAAGDDITIGDTNNVLASNQPTGAIAVKNMEAVTYDNLTGKGHNAVQGGVVFTDGGTDVTVTTNTGGQVYIGTPDMGTGPIGNVTVTDTAGDRNGAFGFGGSGWWNGNWESINVIGGNNVNVTAAGAGVFIGTNLGSGTNTADNPKGSVVINETAWSHQMIDVDGGNGIAVNARGQRVILGQNTGVAGDVIVNQGLSAAVAPGSVNFTGNAAGSAQWLTRVDVYGGNNVTVNTTGGNVNIGEDMGSDNQSHYATGAVVVNDTFSGAGNANNAYINVLGAGAVTVTHANTSNRATNIGEGGTTNTGGTALTNGGASASGDVVVNNSVTWDGTTYVGGAANVFTNGAKNVTINGASGGVMITDVQTTVGTGGKAVGTSNLSNVVLNNVDGAATITSDALASLTISNSTKAAIEPDGFTTSGPTTVTVTDANKHALAVTLSNTSKGTTLTDNTATSMTFGTTGTASNNLVFTGAKLTSLTFNNSASLNVSGSNVGAPGVTTITANNTAALNLGSWTSASAAAPSALTTVNGAGATGAITAQIDGAVTSFTGGKGNDVVTVDVIGTVPAQLSKAISGGDGTDTVILTNVETAYNTLLNPHGPISADFTGFEILGFAKGTTGTYDVSGFSGGVTVSGATGNLTLNNAGSETLTVTGALTGLTTTWSGAGIIVGTSSTKGIDAGVITTVDAATVSLTSNGASGTNLVTLTDSKGSTTELDIIQNGASKLKVTDADATINTILVSGAGKGAVDVTGVVADLSGVSTFGGGAGLFTVNMTSGTGATGNSIGIVSSGTGGVNVTHIGAGNTIGGNTGAEVIFLGNSVAVRDRMFADTTTASGAGTRAIVNDFRLGSTGSIASGDVLQFQAAKTTIANATNVVGLSGSIYTISNGIVTLSKAAVGLTGTAELADVQRIVDQTANTLAAVEIAGNTYVIASNGGTGNATADKAETIFQLNGVTGVTGFGLSTTFGATGTAGVQMGGGSTIMVDTASLTITNFSPYFGDALNSKTVDASGYEAAALFNGAAGVTTTWTNLANWSLFESIGTGLKANMGDVVITQGGTAPKELYYVAIGDTLLSSLTVDGALVVDSQAGNIQVNKVASAAGQSIWLTGAGSITLNAITDSVLTKIDASKTTGAVSLGGTTALSQTGLTITGGTGTLTVKASGANDTITAGDAGSTITATGAANTITVGVGANTITASGAGDTINVGQTAVGGTFGTMQIIHTSGAGTTVNFITAADDGNAVVLGTSWVDGGINGSGVHLGVGANTTVNFGLTTTTQIVWATGDTAGATSGGSVNMVVLGGVDTSVIGDQQVVLRNGSSDAWIGQVNVAAATTLAQAMDIAAKVAALSQQNSATNEAGWIAAGTGVVDWFQFGGNTYIVEAINGGTSQAQHAALAATDMVVKITGLVDLSGAFLNNSQTIDGHSYTVVSM